jgi:hypothetical protein
MLVSVMVVGVGAPPTYGSAFPGANGKLAFTRVAAAGRHIYTVNPDGSGAVDVTPTGAEVYNDEAAVSADGTRIVFVTNRDYAPCCIGQDIYVMNIDGSGASRLTTTNDNRFPDRPTWSADGNKIAYVNAGQIWTMNPDGTAQAPLTSDATYHDMPSWSPDERERHRGVPGKQQFGRRCRANHLVAGRDPGCIRERPRWRGRDLAGRIRRQW